MAKINLGLRVGRRRPDGFHEIRTVLQTIDWTDSLRIEAAAEFRFTSNAEPADDRNLVVRAVRSFERLTGTPARVHIHLEKSIPAGAGLGGGSADAAATVLGLVKLYGARVESERLLDELAGLGSDVPFFAFGGRAIAVSRGEEVYPLEEGPGYWLAVVSPGVAIPTAEAYSWLTGSESTFTIERFCARFLPESEVGPPVNDFESPVFERYPELGEICGTLRAYGAFHAGLSGSGSSLFGQFASQERAERAAAALSGRFEARVTRPVGRREYGERLIAF